MTWPLQSQCDSFYGNPRGRNGQASGVWESANLARITPPFKMTFAGKPITTIRIHKKCADSFMRILNRIWDEAGHDQKKIDATGFSLFGGSYNYRLMRNGHSLSMHSYGCAVDFDPARNGMGDPTPNFANHPWIIKAFEDEGWVWGGRWKNKDGMHWQASRVT